MMVNCWNFEPQDRPTFNDLRYSTSSLIEKIAGYLDMNFMLFSDAEKVITMNNYAEVNWKKY